MAITERKKVLIWGKTAPELSKKYWETVCTGGVLDDGRPVRIYPIPYRYMAEEDRFKKYQWISAIMSKKDDDPRPESYRIDCESIETGESIPTDDHEWGKRAAIMFQQPGWQFDSVDALMAASKSTGASLGVVEPKEILAVELKPRTDEDKMTFEAKKEEVRKRLEAERERVLIDELMPDEMKNLDFSQNRIAVKWRCGSGKEHNMQILDWEIMEPMRRLGDATTLELVKKHLDLSTYAIKFFLGNFRLYPNRFTIVGLWYPKRAKGRLF